jgi:hypothetical protein
MVFRVEPQLTRKGLGRGLRRLRAALGGRIVYFGTRARQGLIIAEAESALGAGGSGPQG